VSSLSDILGFEGFNLKEMARKIKKNPERIFLGAADPASSKMWGKVLGKDYEPITDQWGGASHDTYDKAEAAGIDTKAGHNMHRIARVIAAFYAGGAANNAMGGGGAGGTEGLGGATSSGGNAALSSADKAAMFGEAGYGGGMTGAETSAYDSALAGGGSDFDFPSMNSAQQDQRKRDVVKPLEVEFDAEGRPIIVSSRTKKTAASTPARELVMRGLHGDNVIDELGVKVGLIKEAGLELDAIEQQLDALLKSKGIKA
jgi:hypothetical protein